MNKVYKIMKNLIISSSLILPACANMQIRDPAQFNQALQYWNQFQQPIEQPRAPSMYAPNIYINQK